MLKLLSKSNTLHVSDQILALVLVAVLKNAHTLAYLLCKGLVLQWCVIDLDDALVLLEEILLLGPTVFLDAFNVEAKGSCDKYSMESI